MSQSHTDPNHPRYCTPGRWKAILFFGRVGSKWRMVSIWRTDAGKRVEVRAKNGGRRFLKVMLNDAIARPRKWLHDQYKREVRGARAERCDNEGQRIPRARNMVPGMSGKSFMRRWRKELREEKAQREAA